MRICKSLGNVDSRCISLYVMQTGPARVSTGPPSWGSYRHLDADSGRELFEHICNARIDDFFYQDLTWQTSMRRVGLQQPVPTQDRWWSCQLFKTPASRNNIYRDRCGLRLCYPRLLST